MLLKKFKTVILSSMIFTTPAVAENLDQCPFVVGESFEAISKSNFSELINSFPKEKSQFETTEKFKERQKTHLESSIPQLAILATEMDRDQLLYNADEEYFYYDDFLLSNGRYTPDGDLIAELFNLESRFDYMDLQGINHIVFNSRTETGSYEASNAMGASVTVTEVLYSNVTIYGDHVLDGDTMQLVKRDGDYVKVQKYYGYEPVVTLEAENFFGDMENGPYHVLPYKINNAEKFFNGVQTYTAVDMRSPVILSETEKIPATINVPEERTISNVVIKADIVCSSLVDHQGKVAQILKPLIGFMEYKNKM